MPDIVDKATRSRMMSRIRGRDTKPELALRQALRRHGYPGYRCHYSRVPGRPDVAYVGRRIAIFVDGAFWHGHPDYYVVGKSGPVWDAKIARNVQRDREVDAALFDLGWRSIRVWDFDVLTDADAVVRRLGPVIDRAPSGADGLGDRARSKPRPRSGR
jgi:DNA mismatch endonuclease, patch repair protein